MAGKKTRPPLPAIIRSSINPQQPYDNDIEEHWGHIYAIDFSGIGGQTLRYGQI